jgi:hypothetical protein
MQIIYFVVISLVLFACSVDSGDPTSTQDTDNQDSDTSDATETCKPWLTTCFCDPQVYNEVCCMGETQGYFCRGGGWVSQPYEPGDRCPVDAPSCPFPQ